MPYLNSQDKKMLDAGVAPGTPGELTYLLTRQIQRYLEHQVISYEKLVIVLGSLEGCKADFIERVLRTYEQKKCRENGDAWPMDVIAKTRPWKDPR